MRISDWSSDVCSSDLSSAPCVPAGREVGPALQAISSGVAMLCVPPGALCADAVPAEKASEPAAIARTSCFISVLLLLAMSRRSEEHTSELQSLMRISYAVFCLKKKTNFSTNSNKYYTTNFPIQYPNSTH